MRISEEVNFKFTDFPRGFFIHKYMQSLFLSLSPYRLGKNLQVGIFTWTLQTAWILVEWMYNLKLEGFSTIFSITTQDKLSIQRSSKL